MNDVAAVTRFGRAVPWVTSSTCQSASGLRDLTFAETGDVTQGGGGGVVVMLEYAGHGGIHPAMHGKSYLLETPQEALAGFADVIVASPLQYSGQPRSWFGFVSVPGDTGSRDHDLLDWDAHLQAPAPKATGTIGVTLTFAGRAKPIIVEDPWD